MEIATLAGTALALCGSVVAAYKWAYKKGEKEGRRDLTYSRDCMILDNLYAPLISLLIDVLMSSWTLISYRTFWQRLKHAQEVFQERRYHKSKVKRGFHALFDRGISEPSVGIEHGSSFPSSQIGQVIKEQAHLASPELISLYQRTLREEYERGGISDDLLSAYHLELAEYIFRQHEHFTNLVRFSK